MKKRQYVYNTKSTIDLSDNELKECQNLFNENYGHYRKDSDFRPGEAIRFPMSIYRDYQKEGFYLATARTEGKLVAQAFYIRKKYPDYGVMTWVLQLVVHKDHRKCGIAGRLLHSIWGFSDDYAWGLASANPCTVKTLESATYRKCTASVISKEIDAVKMITDDIAFIRSDSFDVNEERSFVDTKFFVDNSSNTSIENIENNLGKLKPGYEWLAVTFQSQRPSKEMYKKHFKELLEFSESRLKEAYARMSMNTHGWTGKTSDEADYLCRFLKKGSVLDMGCGHGRHSIELARRGFDVTGVDFVRENIDDARKKASEMALNNAAFITDDLRETRFGNKYNNVICLYDVVGSFPESRDNMKLIKTAYENLLSGGVFVISVMNMELTEKLVGKENIISVQKTPDALVRLKASSRMQKSGDVFDGSSMIIDKDTGIVYRKEQFDNDNELSAEFIIRDKRYTMNEISSLLEKTGFRIIEKNYTRIGFKDFYGPADPHAKEILIVAEKP